MLSEEEYRQEWLKGLHNTDYNNCRFSEDKVKFAKEWLLSFQPTTSFDKINNIVDNVCQQKIRIITDTNYCNLCQIWADKISVRNKITELQLEDTLIPTNIINQTNGHIDPESLRDHLVNDFKEYPSVILKCNHGSGWNIIVHRNKEIKTLDYIEKKLNEWLFLNYAYISGYEKQYENINPQVLIQPVLVNMPIDYGFWCINGNIEGISLTRKLGKNLEEYIAFVDKFGHKMNWRIALEPALTNLPNSFMNRVNKMIPIAEKIAKPFDFVRVDLFYINNKVYFGETTFTPCSGVLDYCIQ